MGRSRLLKLGKTLIVGGQPPSQASSGASRIFTTTWALNRLAFTHFSSLKLSRMYIQVTVGSRQLLPGTTFGRSCVYALLYVATRAMNILDFTCFIARINSEASETLTWTTAS